MGCLSEGRMALHKRPMELSDLDRLGRISYARKVTARYSPKSPPAMVPPTSRDPV